MYNVAFTTEFSSNSRVLTLTEPADGRDGIPISLTVDRNGGTTGIVSAQWEIIRSDGKYCHYNTTMHVDGGK